MTTKSAKLQSSYQPDYPSTPLPRARRLVQHQNQMLVLSTQGFVLAFRDKTMVEVAQQLKHFDATEWYERIEKSYYYELQGLDYGLLSHAGHLLHNMAEESRNLLQAHLLEIAQDNLITYNRLHSSDPFRAKARLQAMQVLPLLRWEYQYNKKEMDSVRLRIDAGDSVWEAYTASYPGKIATLKRIANSKNIPWIWRGSLAYLLSLLDAIPLEKFPVSTEDWNAFECIQLGLRMSREYNPYKLEVKKRWLAEAGRMGWQKALAKFMSQEGGVASLGNTFDFLDELANAGFWLRKHVRQCRSNEELPYEEQYKQHWMRAPDSLGMSRLVDASIQWHRILMERHQVQEDGNRTTSRSWQPLFEFPAELSDDVVAVVLKTQDELKQESERMAHCVGIFLQKCFFGQCHIISLRDRSGQSLSTIEIQVGQDKEHTLYIIQHCTFNNEAAPKALQDLEPRLLAYIQRHADWSALDQWRDKAANSKLRYQGEGAFSIWNLRRLCAALGRERVLGLFVDVSTIREAVRVYKEQNVIESKVKKIQVTA